MHSPGKVVFSHGLESGPWGLKITALAEVARSAGWSVESIDYQDTRDPMTRVARLVDYCKGLDEPVLLVGSSMGAAVAAHAAASVPVSGVFLMATAVYVPGYEGMNPVPLTVPSVLVHGWRDEVIPYQNALRFALESRAGYVLLDDDHGLAASVPRLEQQFKKFLVLFG